MPEPEWVRVRQPETGHHISVHRSVAAAHDLTPLKQSGVDANGDPLRPKYRVDKGSTGKTASATDTATATEKES